MFSNPSRSVVPCCFSFKFRRVSSFNVSSPNHTNRKNKSIRKTAGNCIRWNSNRSNFAQSSPAVRMAEQAMAHGLQSRSKTNGSIELILGPMFSGKTTELFRRIRRYTFANYKCAVVKYKNDQRYSSEKAATHDKVTLQAYSCLELSEVDDLVNDFDVIAIDEGQFFPDLVGFCEKFANLGKILIVGSLDGTFHESLSATRSISFRSPNRSPS
eukprot:445724_1